MNKQKIQKIIDQGFSCLYPLSCKSSTDIRDAMLQEEIKTEKMFRKCAPSDQKRQSFSVSTKAKYFVLSSIRSAMLCPSDAFRPRDILHCKQSYILAHAVKDDPRFDLEEMFFDFDWEAFNDIEHRWGDLYWFGSTEEAA